MRLSRFQTIPYRPLVCPQSAGGLAVVLLALLLIGGCGEGEGLEDPALVGIVPSARLAPYLAASSRLLAGPDKGDPVVRGDLGTYFEILQGIYDKDRRTAAVESLFTLWRARPDHVLWPELAVRERRFMGDGSRRREMFADPACADTSTAIGAYMLAWRLHTMAAYTTLFQAARDRSGELDPFAALWIDLKAAYGVRLGGHPERSVDIALDVLPRAGELGGRRLAALVWVEIARAMLAVGELDDALHASAMAEALTVAVISDGEAVVGLLLIRRLKADILAARRDTHGALALYEANVEVAAGLNLAFLASRNLNRAGMLAEAVGDRELGLQYCRGGLDFALSDQDSLNVPRHLMNIARRFRLAGDLDSCLVYQGRAERWVEAYPDPVNVARMPLMQAEYYAQVGEYAVVDSLLNTAAVMAHHADTIEARSELHLELIRGWMETDRPDLIYRSIAAVDDLRGGIGDIHADRHINADLSLLIGEFLTYRGEYVRAAESLELAADALERRPNPSRAWTLARNRGILARERGSLAAAEAEFRTCIALGVELGTPEMESTGRFLLGSVLLADGRFAEARAAFPATDAASFAGRFTTRVSALLLTGISHDREGDHELALKVFAEAGEACRSWSPPDLIARIDLETGRALAGAGRVVDAGRLYDDVAVRLEGSAGDGTTPELAYFNGDLRRDLVEAVMMLPAADPLKTLHLARRILPRWRSVPSAGGDRLASPQIIFFVGQRMSRRWILNDPEVRWTALPGEQDLNDLLAPVVADMAVPGRPVIEDDVQRLAEVLLNDVVDVWPAGRTLAIVPDLALFGIPWAALPLPGGSGVLVDHGPLAILDMPATKRDGERIHRPDGHLLVVGADGNAGVVNAGLPALHHAEREARDVAAAWPFGQSTLRVGTAAARALTGNSDLVSFEAIHVASHAVVLEGRFDQTMLLLAGEDAEALTATAIRELDLDAEVVFLSCCEAGDGRDTHSDYAGLARSFLDAGARHVVAPLLVIDDEAARALAVRFNTHWLAGLPVPGALRAAQRDLRDGDPRWAHPFYWAFYQPIVAE